MRENPGHSLIWAIKCPIRSSLQGHDYKDPKSSYWVEPLRCKSPSLTYQWLVDIMRSEFKLLGIQIWSNSSCFHYYLYLNSLYRGNINHMLSITSDMLPTLLCICSRGGGGHYIVLEISHCGIFYIKKLSTHLKKMIIIID